MKLLIHPAIDPDREVAVREAAAAMHVVNAADEDAALREIVDADAFFGKMTPQLLAAAERLQWVQSPTASLEHYLFPELIEHPCRLSNMRGLFSDIIADHVLGYVLCFARNIPQYLRAQAQRRWEPVGGESSRPSNAAGPGLVSDIDRRHQHLADQTLGIVGVGAIGAEIARRAAAFSMRVIGVDPVRRRVDGVIDQVWPTDQLPALLSQSDYVVIAAPHTPETEKLFRKDQFAAMKPTAVLINIGRGVIVDLADLTAALEEGQIAGAALDVFEVEPLPAEHPLWGMENVILTPHVAAASPRIAGRHTQVLLENVRRFAAGEDPLNLVDKRRWF
jgi:phosphoglycerate dehydrogenase-like enzyme